MEPSNNTETEDENTAFKRKRARRVSFADNEITSVHIFRRDDDDSSGTPPISASASASTSDPEVLGFFRDLGGDSDDDEQNLKESPSPPDGEVANGRDSFLRPIGSPSPCGSSTAGSAASTDDDDDFHGPVSASFIRPERLSDSGISDDNHDLTMDSTAFSLHYRSLAQSDSGDLKTPTRFGLQFEDKTPSQTSSPRAASGSFMVLTKAKKQSSQPEIPANAASGGRDSSDMSIVGENPKSYDYGRLSPTLDAILAEGSKDLSAASPLDSKAADLPNINGYSMAEGSINLDMGNAGKDDMPVKELAEVPSNLVDLNRCSISSPVDQATNDLLYKKCDNTVSDVDIHRNQTYDSSIKEIKEVVKGANVSVCKQLDFTNANRGSPLKMHEGYQLNVSAQYELGYNKDQVKETNPKDREKVSDINHESEEVNGNPIHGLTPLSFDGRKQLITVSPDSSRYTGSISISKLKTLETSPCTSTLKEGIDRLKCRLSKYSPGTSLFNEKDCQYNQVETLNAPLTSTPENNMRQGLSNIDDHGNESFRNINNLSQNEETIDTRKDKENFHLISVDDSSNDENLKPVEMEASPSQVTHLARLVDSDLEDFAVENRKDEIMIAMHDIPFPSPDQMLSPSTNCQRNCCDELKELDKKNESFNSGLGHAIECNSETVANKLELSGFVNSEKPSSPFEVSQNYKFAKNASKRKLVESPANRVVVLSTPIQEMTSLLPSDGHGPLDNDNHPALQVTQSPLTKSGIEVSSGKKRKGVEPLNNGDNIDKIGRTDRSPEVHKSGNTDLQLVLKQTVHMKGEIEKVGDRTWNDWTDVWLLFYVKN